MSESKAEADLDHIDEIDEWLVLCDYMEHGHSITVLTSVVDIRELQKASRLANCVNIWNMDIQ